VLLATVIAIPIAWVVMYNWLQSFAYRTGLQWWVFALSSLVTVAIALLTVSFRAVRAAIANPTKSLRSEG
jgi:putative ABC transport system permease protein